MKDDELKKALESLSVPELDPTARDRALDRATTALRNQPALDERDTRPLPWKPFLAGLAFASIVFASIWMAKEKAAPRRDTDHIVLDQLSRLFPDRLEAVVEHNGQVDLRLASEDVPPSQQPLLLVLTRGREVVKVLSYSGRRVCLKLDGRETCLEVLATDNGSVIVSGQKFLWSPQNPASLDGYRIEAHSLPTS